MIEALEKLIDHMMDSPNEKKTKKPVKASITVISLGKKPKKAKRDE